MAHPELDRLCARLSNMEADKLYSLDDYNFECLPKIRGMPVPEAVDTLHNRIAAFPYTYNHLACIAHVYSSLMPKGLIGPWVLYRLDEPPTGNSNPWRRLLDALASKYEPLCSRKVTDERTCVCAIVRRREVENTAQEFYCFCFWTTLACVAVYNPSEEYSDADPEVIRKVLYGDPDSLKMGDYDDLDSAHQAARESAPR